jgi:hypothetical protein
MSLSIAEHHGERIASAPFTLAGSRDYAVFGGVLRTDLDFPELGPALTSTPSRIPDWTFRVSHDQPPDDDPHVSLGERQLGPEVYRLSRGHTAFRLEYSHAGHFDIALDGHRMTWYQRQDAELELVRAIVLGPAISLALQARGLLCLHGSAVTIDRRAVAFIGPRFFGKSTIAAALVGAGARIAADDLLVVEHGSPTMLRPGVPSLRLWNDSVEALGNRPVVTSRPRLKTNVGVARDLRVDCDTPLAAIYVLQPVAADDQLEQDAAWRTELSPVAATIALSHHAKLADPLVGLAAAGARLRLAAMVAGSVPMWTLHVVRDFGRFDDLAAKLFTWTVGIGRPPTWNHEEKLA